MGPQGSGLPLPIWRVGRRQGICGVSGMEQRGGQPSLVTTLACQTISLLPPPSGSTASPPTNNTDAGACRSSWGQHRLVRVLPSGDPGVLQDSTSSSKGHRSFVPQPLPRGPESSPDTAPYCAIQGPLIPLACDSVN